MVQSPIQAKAKRVVMTSQELSLLSNLTVVENLCICDIPTKMFFTRAGKMKEKADKILRLLDIEYLKERKIESLSASEQYMIEFAKALMQQPEVLIVDEITSALYSSDVEKVGNILKMLRRKGVSVLFISHRMEEIFAFCDTVTVMRNGNTLGTYPVKAVNASRLLSEMTGREIVKSEIKISAGQEQEGHEELLAVKGLRLKGFDTSIDFTVRRGEIIGITGLEGHGQSALVRALFGLNGKYHLQYLGKTTVIRSCTDAVKHKMAFISGDRVREGIFGERSIADNTEVTAKQVLAEKSVHVSETLKKFHVKYGSVKHRITSLSGGNQQKVVIARWVVSKPMLVLTDDPTKGVDVQARKDIHDIFLELAAHGSAVVMVSSDEEELIELSRNAANARILIMYEGKIVKELRGGVSDGDPKVHKTLQPIVQKQLDALVNELQKDGRVEVIEARMLASSVRTAREQAEYLRSQRIEGVIISHAVFAYPNFSAVIASNLNMPVLLFANLFPDWPGMVSMLAAGGALDHLGIDHFRAAGDIASPEVLDQVVRFAKCAHAASCLNGQKYGLIGGRSLGMYSAQVSMQHWQKKFGVDVDHMDQSEILRLAEEVPAEQVEKAFRWLLGNCKAVHFDGLRLTEEKLKTQIRHYEALKRIVRENQYDFLGVKCHYEMSRHYCTECVAAALMNDPYDWDGPKEPTVYACEADSDAALTMQILKLLTGKPVLFMDVRHYDAAEDVMVFCNCGSQSTYYAAASEDPGENLSRVTLYPCLEIYAGGGCHVNCMTAPGEVTMPRLNRYKDDYRMTIIPGEIVTLPEEKMEETTKEWPHNFVKLPFDHRIFLNKFSSNHCHAVYGNCREELIMICKMLRIDYEVLGE